MKAVRSLAWSLAAALPMLADLGGAARSAEAPVAVTCANASSGARWQIEIDYDKRTVDSYPATFSKAQIVWRDTKDRTLNTLDRASGDLTQVGASSMGGYFLYHRCALKNSG